MSSQVFGHLRSFKGWIQTEACVIPSYHGMLIGHRLEMFLRWKNAVFVTLEI